jgi:nickel superoxide dismutase
MRLRSLLTPSTTIHAHCDLPCGVYDPAQARIEAQSGLHQLFWDATKAAGAAKKSEDPADGQKVIDLVDQIADVFAATKKQPAARKPSEEAR